MEQYHDLLRHIRKNGRIKGDRTGTGTQSTFGYQNRYNLTEGFPLVTTKKMPFKMIANELLWFLRGSTDVVELIKVKCPIWTDDAYRQFRSKTGLPSISSTTDEFEKGREEFTKQLLSNDAFAKEHGNLGPVYGYQWRSWPTPDGGHIDQIKNLIADIKKNPDNRRLIVTAWNPADIAKMTLPPCHCLFQFESHDATPEERLAYWVGLYPEFEGMVSGVNVTDEAVDTLKKDGRIAPRKMLSCHLYQRSADSFLGVPFNIASYALLTMMVAQVCDMIPFEFVHSFGDMHIYTNHFEQVDLQLSRTPHPWPTVRLNPNVKDIFGFTIDDITLENYDPDPAIEGKISV